MNAIGRQPGGMLCVALSLLAAAVAGRWRGARGRRAVARLGKRAVCLAGFGPAAGV